jgi:UDP-N-acetylglucosamine--N-acetylmuramyl-(pentapeptide) pyrophosphoryl-undecaprenol N-acetylglucosamine transferase
VRVLITGGGTGGHVFPAIAVADALRRAAPQVELLFVGGARGFEARAAAEAGIPFHAVPARGLLGSRWLSVPAILWTTVRGVFASLAVMRRFRPDVIFATGGYVSGAVAVAGWLLRCPIVLHEQNSIPGLTNRLLSRIAQEVHLNTPAARRHFPRRSHLKLSGNPIRRSVLQGDPGHAQQIFRLERGRRTVLIFGGSQGARSLNRAAVSAIQRLGTREDLQFILQTGPRDHSWVAQRLRGSGMPVEVRAFIDEMGDAYSLADLVVARAGAMTLAEITACGKASVLVPYPYATHNHQESNARSLMDAGAAVMILDRALQGDVLAGQISKLIDTPRKLREMSANALRLARPNAAEKIAAALLRFVPAEGTPAPPEERPQPGRENRGGGATGREGRRPRGGPARLKSVR